MSKSCIGARRILQVRYEMTAFGRWHASPKDMG